jgi:DNA-directed RNA polymerase subunit RPC12/RpoP
LKERIMWFFVLGGLVFLLLYAPLGIILIIVGAIIGAYGQIFRKIRCPWCSERVQYDAIVCPHCRNNIEAGFKR